MRDMTLMRLWKSTSLSDGKPRLSSSTVDSVMVFTGVCTAQEDLWRPWCSTERGPYLNAKCVIDSLL
ncbi:hypothetical protein CN204_30230 [Sinorhizobium meliloti]|nr:hypothetical protein SMRU11_07660 [Sinorhizobium meliloti RU11/001]PST22619.1 hypothetical protein C7U62_21230 [Mesorhizobium loti]RVG53950.1 hypothetical protein CN222_36410 [Sinorhizobium meliloti]RVG84741.1 hypothetical protein CN221_32820 [Sinorhizobium meliloti]RVH52556.1 hypothetical protein CN213_25485 [Sinorhizobium meliloti]